jgi:hypothetical protein
MTDQTVTIGLYGPTGGRIYEAAATYAEVTEITSKTGTLSLYKLQEGQVITHGGGEYATGIGYGIIRNTITNKIKARIYLDVIGEMRYRELRQPVTIEKNDILEAYCDEA